MRLTLPQQDIYFEQLLYSNEPIHNIGAKVAITGKIDFDILNEAFIMLIKQHDAYRSIVVRKGENVEIEILAEHNSSLGFIDFSMKEDADREADIFMQSTFLETFNFENKTLLHKFILVKVTENLHYIFSMYHHIITDGWGTSLMFQRWVKNYNELITYGNVITEYPYSYKDFVIDDEIYANSDDFIKDKIYWKDKFQNLSSRLFEKRDETVNINKSNRKELMIKRSVYNQLLDIAKIYKCSTFHLILGILFLYFGRKHQNKDFAIGVPVLNRGKSVFKKTVGLFMGVSILRLQLDFENTFENLVYQIKRQLRQDYRHQRFPLGKLIQELDLFQDADRLFNMTLSYENQNYADHFINTKTSVIPLTHESERVALAVYIREFDELEDVKIDFDYNINYFDEKSINQVVTQFEHLLRNVITNKNKKLSDYKYISTKEKQQLLKDFNQTSFDYNKKTTLLSFFDRQVEKKPNHVAIRDKINEYTYKELDVKSNQIANYLTLNFENKRKLPIAVLMERSVNLVVTLLGILKSGRAYIPLDPSFPEERINYIISQSEVKLIIGTNELENFIKSEVEFIDVETILSVVDTSKIDIINEVKPSDTAYIIYTSGSTGKPKGVEVGHQSLLNFLLSIQQKPKIKTEDLLLSVTTQSFDISILEFFTPLISGATVYVIENDILKDPLAIIKRLKQVKPTVMQATPSFYQMLYNADWKGDKKLKVLVGGDLLSESLAENLTNTCAEVWNMYGPTETTIWSSIKKITTPKDASIIGKPIHNTTFYILDKYKELLPIGTAGDIYIGGDGLAKGYFKNEPLTEEKFIKNPFDEKGKIYETGDVGKWNIKGEIEFLGRNDHQVKIRGFRIELSEIETKLNELDIVISSVVIAKKRTNQEAFLVAYVIFNQENFVAEDIIVALSMELPEYMIPYVINPVESFPLTSNNKVDRKSLTLRDLDYSIIQTEHKKPVTNLEYELCIYYQEVLELKDKIGTTDNFFQLGGHSLNAVRLIGKIEKHLGYQITLRTIFDYPNVDLLSKLLEKRESQQLKSITQTEIKSHYPITLPQYAIWLASLQSEKSIAYNMFRSYRVVGNFDAILLEKAFQKVIYRHEALRTNFVESEGFPHQIIKSANEFFFKIDQFFVDESEVEQELEMYANQEFDLKNETLMRLGLFETSTGNNFLLFVTHHIIMDGWALEILIKDVVEYYRAVTSGIELEKDKLNFQFKDYAVWQHKKERENESINKQFWEQYLNNYQWGKLISYDQEKLSNKKYSGSTYHFDWDKTFLDQLKGTALKQNITLHTLLVTVFNILIYKMQGLKDICIGTINSGRLSSDLHPQVGMFVKTLPLRLKVDPNLTVKTLLQNVQDDMLAIDKHQDIPEDILSSLRLEAILVLQNPTFNYEKLEINENVKLKFHPVNASYDRLPLLLNFSFNEEYLHGSIDTSKYDKETIELFVLKFKKILEEIIINTDISIYSINADLAFEELKSIEINFNF